MEVVKIPKLEKIQLTQKMMIEPFALRGSIPKNKLPFIHNGGVVVSMEPLKLSPALLGDTSKMKVEIVYDALWLNLTGKYVEVEVLDELEDHMWIGTLFGYNVQGEGGQGDVRPCKITSFQQEGETFKADSLEIQPGNKKWQKVKNKVDELLEQ